MTCRVMAQAAQLAASRPARCAACDMMLQQTLLIRACSDDRHAAGSPSSAAMAALAARVHAGIPAGKLPRPVPASLEVGWPAA